MKSIVIVTIVSVIVSIGIYKGIRKVLYKKDVTNKASFARLIKYVLVFINGMIFLGQFEQTKPIMSYLAASSGVVALVLGVAAKDAFGNLCSGLMILTFKPFVEGDLIKVNQSELIGYVESIRFRHTNIRTYESNRIIVPNSTLNSATIENAFFQDARKNNYLEIEVSYGTDIDLAIDILKSLVEKTMEEYDIESETPIEVKVINFSATGIDLRVVVPSKTSLDGFDMLAKIRYELVKEYGKVFYHEMQVWASKGYFVFFCNIHGSDGRGNEFMDIRGKYGTIDYDELMQFTDTVLETYPQIDSSRVGVTGGSYGGFMTNWIIGHTDRFACAASQRSIANWISFSQTSDIGPYFAQDQQSTTYDENPEKLWWHSPLKYARNVKTPTLFIHSDEDYRCPLCEGLQMLNALLDQNIEARMCLFHGENHDLSRTGLPQHRLRRLNEITNWMEKHLK